MSYISPGRENASKKEGALIRSLEKEFKVKFGVPGDTKITTYLRKEGLPSLANALEKLEQT